MPKKNISAVMRARSVRESSAPGPDGSKSKSIKISSAEDFPTIPEPEELERRWVEVAKEMNVAASMQQRMSDKEKWHMICMWVSAGCAVVGDGD